MRLPPEFNSWDEVWDEHQLRGRMIRDLKARLAVCEEAMRTIDTMPVDGCSPSVIESMLRQAKSLAYAALKEPT